MGSTIILVHSYYNVWLRAQLGWQSFLLRRDAVNKIKSLPTASKAQLEQYNDICAICYQVSAAIAYVYLKRGHSRFCDFYTCKCWQDWI